jgi:hypothetical protein
MKKLNLLLVTGAAATLMTANVFAGDTLPTPRAKDQAAKPAKAETAPNTVASPIYVAGTPRTADQQAKKPVGKADTQVMSCTRNMTSSPKSVGECASHPGAAMPCCAVANAR